MAESAETFVFNVIITPGTFRYLQLFTRSLLAKSSGRIRLVSNACPPDELMAMRDFMVEQNGRVDVFALSTPTIVPHGVALDETYAAHDDGDFFCFVDSDVKAKRPFMDLFVELLTQVEVVTSCNVAWSDDTILPPGAPDVVGRHAVGHDGFVYGSSYLAMYRRAPVERVRETWGVTFRAYAYDKLPEPVQRRLHDMGREFRLYDTAKVCNILLQGDGSVVTHVDNPALVHVGGISQYLSDPRVLGRSPGESAGDGSVPWFAVAGAGRDRWDFAQWASTMLRHIVDGEPAPELPEESGRRRRATEMRRELLDLVGR